YPAYGGTTRTWTGSVNNLWSNPNNWNPVGMPQNGDYLLFDENSDNNEMVNDMVGLTVAGLSFSDESAFFGTDHQLGGQTLSLTGDLYNGLSHFGSSQGFTTVINCALIFTNLTYGVASISTGGSTGHWTETTQDIELNGPITIS